jgi:hypothetical protein
MKILIWAILATLSSGGLGYLSFRLWKWRINDRDHFVEEVMDLRVKIKEQEKEIKRREHIIKAMEEVSREAAKKKKELRKGGGTDSARRATDIMQDLAGNGSSDGDGSTTGD